MMRKATMGLVGAMLVAVAGCESMEESMSLRKPTVRFVGMEFRDADAYGATVVFEVQIMNHYATDLPLVRFRYTVSSRGEPFMAGLSQLAMRIPVAGSETVMLPARIDYAETLRRLGGVQPGTTIPYEAQVDLTVETPRLGTIELPMSRTGQVVLPQVAGLNADKPQGGAR